MRILRCPELAASLFAAALLAVPGVGQTSTALTLPAEVKIDASAEELSHVSFVAPFNDGTMAVAQSQDGRVLFFSQDGRRLGAFGRSGAGPGEFRMVGLYGWVGDTLWVGDANLHRVTLLTAGRQLVRTLAWPTTQLGAMGRASGMPAYHNARIFGVLPDGELLVVGGITGLEQSSQWSKVLHNMNAVVIRATADGSPSSFVAGLPYAPNCVLELAGSRVGLPECAEPVWAVDRDAARIAVVSPDVSNPREGMMRVVLVATSGDTVYDRRVPIPLVPITSEQADSLRSREAAATSNPDRARAWRSAKLPAVFSPVKSTTFVARDGAVWVEIRSATPGHSWVILSPDGRRWRTLLVPKNVRLMTADGQRVWGTEADEDGLESVVRYRYR